jgi:hypothetical protein
MNSDLAAAGRFYAEGLTVLTGSDVRVKKSEFNPPAHPMKSIGGRKSVHAAERLNNSR